MAEQGAKKASGRARTGSPAKAKSERAGSSTKRTARRRPASGAAGSRSASTGASGSSSRSANSGSGSGTGSGGGGLTAREAVQQARSQLAELMGRSVEAVLGLERDDAGWVVMVQVVELARIPNSTDVLGEYAVTLDLDGEVIGYRRARRYHRSQADG